MAAISEQEIEQYRRDTPAVEQIIHFNNAGAALRPSSVDQAVIEQIQNENQWGGYRADELSEERLNSVYGSVARLIGCHPDEVALTENATTAWNTAIRGIQYRPGDEILASMVAYGSNFLSFLHLQKLQGVQVRIVPSDINGQISLAKLEEMINERTRLIALTHVPTNSGLINPIVEVGKMAREKGITYLVDATQSAGQIPLDVDSIGCDLLCATGRKYLRGPRGTGFLYVRRKIMDQIEPAIVDTFSARWLNKSGYALRPNARRFEYFEYSRANRLGLGVAVDYALEIGISRIWDRVSLLSDRLRMGLEEIPGISITDIGKHKCGLVTFVHEQKSPKEVKAFLRENEVNVSISEKGATLLDMEARNLEAVTRASVHYYNTLAEVERFTELIRQL